MKIGQPSDNSPAVNTTAQPAAAKGGQGAAVQAAKSMPAAGVAVTVSTLARTLEASNRGSSAAVDMAKVKAVRAAIQEGTYVVDAEAIADKLLANAQEMLNHARR